MKLKLTEELELKLKENPNHPFNSRSKYYTDFLNYFAKIEISQKFETKKSRNSLWNKLQLHNNYNQQTYCQGICEIMLYLYLINSDLNFETEKKITEKNTDVDIQIQNRFTYNIEIKCPTLELKNSANVLNIKIPYRTVPKDICSQETNKFVNNFIKFPLSDEDSQYTSVKAITPNDNKLVEYFKSAQKKFCLPNEQICNVLFVGLPTSEIDDYYSYLMNKYSGIFNGLEPIMQSEEFDKIDVVILSNIVDGHSKTPIPINSWDLSEYFTLMIENPKCINRSKIAREHLLSIIPNSNNHFEKYSKEFYQSIFNEAIFQNDFDLCELLPVLLFPHYFSQFYPIFWNHD